MPIIDSKTGKIRNDYTVEKLGMNFPRFTGHQVKSYN